MFPLTKWVKILIAANVVVFLITMANPALEYTLALYPPWLAYRPWTVVTYMFVHGGVAHILFNMLGLLFLGPRVEERLGGKHFLGLYFVSGLGAALLSVLFARNAAVIGASGAVLGVVLAYAMYWPREKLYVFFVLPMEAWLLVVLFAAVTLYLGMSGETFGIAQFAHLGGMAFGFGYVKWHGWRSGAGRRAFQRAVSPAPAAKVSDKTALNRWRTISVAGMHQLNREEVERLLAKAEHGGPASLSQAERDFLDRMAG